MSYNVELTKNAQKDIKLLRTQKALLSKASKLLQILEVNPFQSPPSYEKLSGDLKGKFSRRINIQHRIVYEVDEENKVVIILSLWSHYEF